MPIRSKAKQSVLLRSLLAFLLATTGATAQVVPDGSTDTVIDLGRDGAVTVRVAPAGRSGVSLNRYERFNVPRPGVRLDNQQEAARTIVNEVTSTERSTISGPVEVLGQRAHVIIANPNGIVFDGARFINTGRVAATTGRITLEARQIAPGVFQENPVATVTGGKIKVHAGGLSGQMDTVDLIAHELSVSGALRNDDTRDGAAIRLVAGQSRTEFDSAVLPGNVAANWGRTTAQGKNNQPSYLVEITRDGVLRANRIGIEVNGEGAGVRFAGMGHAGARGFSLTSDGDVVVDGGRITAADHGAVTLSARQLDLKRAEVSARTISAEVSGDLNNTDSRLLVQGDQDHPGIIYLDADRDVIDAGGVYASDSQIVIKSSANLSFSGSEIRTDGILSLTAAGTLSAQDASLRSKGHLVGQAGVMQFSGKARQTEIVAEAGSLVLSSQGNLENNGALLQGGTATEDLATPSGTQAAGAVTLHAGGDISNRSDKQLAVVFGAAGNLTATAGESIDNWHGRFLANGRIDLTAGGAVTNHVELPNDQQAPFITQVRRSGKRVWWTLGLKRERHYRLSYDFGEVTRPSWIAQVTGTEGVRIHAGTRVLNEGGNIGSAEGDIILSAPVVETASVGSGRVELRRICVLACSYEGSGTVLSYGGGIEAGRDLSIHASGQLLNDGGTLYAGRNIDIETGQLDVRANLIPVVAHRPGGLYNFWSSRAAWVFLREQYGQILADTGRLTVNSPTPVRLQGGRLVARKGVELSSGEELVAPPDMPTYSPDAIGLLRGLPSLER